MTARLTMLLVAAMAVGVLAVGCGGSGDGGQSSGTDSSVNSSSSPVATSSLSKAAFIKKASVICNRGREKALFSYQPPAGATQSQSEVFADAIETTIAPAYREVAVELHDLGAPHGDEAVIEAYLDALEQGIDGIEERRTSISNLKQLEVSLQSSGAIARRYGMEDCSFGWIIPS